MDFTLVTEAAELPAIIAACRSKPAVAIDTEFARTNTYYPIVGLVQIYDGDRCYLIDPLEVKNIEPLAELLADESVVKVLHACSEDVEVFCDALDVVPAPIFDTQIAAAILGVGFSMSYQKVVQHYCDVLIPKEETRSDWLARPLTHAQLEYAALDVTHLLDVYECQQQQLQETERTSWMAEECATLADDIPTQIDPDDYYHKVKNLWRLDGKQLFTLQKLCAWRERTARERNLPRNRVVDEKSLYQIAALGLSDRKAFRDQGGVTSRQLKAHADELEALIDEIDSASPDDFPPLVTKVGSPVSSKVVRALKEVVEETAAQVNIAPEMLAKRRHLEQLVRSGKNGNEYELPRALTGWRETIIGEALLAKVAGLNP